MTLHDFVVYFCKLIHSAWFHDIHLYKLSKINLYLVRLWVVRMFKIQTSKQFFLKLHFFHFFLRIKSTKVFTKVKHGKINIETVTGCHILDVFSAAKHDATKFAARLVISKIYIYSTTYYIYYIFWIYVKFLLKIFNNKKYKK